MLDVKEKEESKLHQRTDEEQNAELIVPCTNLAKALGEAVIQKDIKLLFSRKGDELDGKIRGLAKALYEFLIKPDNKKMMMRGEVEKYKKLFTELY